MIHPTRRLVVLAATAFLTACGLVVPSSAAPTGKGLPRVAVGNSAPGNPVPVRRAPAVPNKPGNNLNGGLIQAIDQVMGLIVQAQKQDMRAPELNRALRTLVDALTGNGHEHHHGHHGKDRDGAGGHDRKGGAGEKAQAIAGGKDKQNSGKHTGAQVGPMKPDPVKKNNPVVVAQKPNGGQGAKKK